MNEKIIPAGTSPVTLTIDQLKTVLIEALAAYFDGKPSSKELLHGIPALAKALGLSLSHTKRLVAAGDIPFIKLSTRKIVFDLDIVLNALEKGGKK